MKSDVKLYRPKAKCQNGRVAQGGKYIEHKGVHILLSDAGEKKPDRWGTKGDWVLYGGIPVGIVLLVVASNTVLADSGSSPFFEQKSETGVQIDGSPSVESQVTIPSPSAEFDLVYPVLNDEEKLAAMGDFYKAKSQMQALLGNKQYEDLKNFEPLIKSAADKERVPSTLLLGLVGTESLGDASAESGVGAAGLTQMMVPVAAKYNLYDEENNIDVRKTDPEAVLSATASEIREYYDRFGDWGMAFWAWHIGTGEVYWAVSAYARLEYGVFLEDVNVVPGNDSPQALVEATAKAQEIMGQYRQFIASRGVNLQKLFANQTISSKYEGSEWDRTREYVPRIIATAAVLSEMDLMEKTGQVFEN